MKMFFCQIIIFFIYCNQNIIKPRAKLFYWIVNQPILNRCPFKKMETVRRIDNLCSILSSISKCQSANHSADWRLRMYQIIMFPICNSFQLLISKHHILNCKNTSRTFCIHHTDMLSFQYFPKICNFFLAYWIFFSKIAGDIYLISHVLQYLDIFHIEFVNHGCN